MIPTPTIVHADCREALLHYVAEVDLILTDPPYGVSNKRNAARASAAFSGYSSNKGAWDVPVAANLWVPAAAAALRPGGIFACFGTLGSLAPIFFELEQLNLTFQSHITWHKTNPAPSIHRRMLTHANELVLVYSKGAKWTFDYAYAKSLNHGRQCHNHFDLPCVRKVLGVTRKPPVLCDRLVRLFTKPGDVVLDPFAGSGAIPEAAWRAGRRAVAVEVRDDLCVHMQTLWAA